MFSKSSSIRHTNYNAKCSTFLARQYRQTQLPTHFFHQRTSAEILSQQKLGSCIPSIREQPPLCKRHPPKRYCSGPSYWVDTSKFPTKRQQQEVVYDARCVGVHCRDEDRCQNYEEVEMAFLEWLPTQQTDVYGDLISKIG